MKPTIKSQLLRKSAIALSVAVISTGASAADVTINSPETTAQTVPNNGDRLVVTTGGDILTAGTAFDTQNRTGVSVLVETGNAATGIRSTGGIAIDARNAATTLSGVQLNSGIITTGGTETISVGGASSTFNINTASGSTISNTNVSGAAILINDANGNKFVTINNSGTISSNGNAINATQSGGTVTVNNNNNITGNITANGTIGYTGNGASVLDGDFTTGAGSSTFVLNGSSRATGNVDLGLNNSSTINLNGTSKIEGNVTLGTDDQILTLNGGTVDGSITGNGTVDVTSNTTFTNANALNVTELRVLNNSIVGFNSDVNSITADVYVNNGALNLARTTGAGRTINGDLSVAADGVVNLGNLAHNVNGDLTTSATSGLVLNITGDDGSQYGRVNVSGDVNINDKTRVNVQINPNVTYVADGAVYTIAQGTGGTSTSLDNDADQITINGVAGSNKTAVLTFNSESNGDDFILNASRATYRSLAGNSNQAAVGDAINSIAGASTGNLADLQNHLDTVLTAGEVQSGLESATAQTDNSATQGVYFTASKAIDAASNRLSQTRGQGISSGDAVGDRGVWIQGFGSYADQGNRGGVTGYESDTYGIAIGGDKQISDRTRVGVSLNYANSDVDSNSGLKNLDIDTYQINVYGTQDHGKFYVDGLAGFAWNEYSSDRSIPAVGARAKGEFDGQAYLARVGAGYRTNFKGLEITPNASLTYAHVATSDYSEKNAGTLNLDVDSDSVNILEPRVGVDVGYTVARNSYKVRPEVRASYGYDVIGESQSSTSRFTGTAPSFTTEGADIARHSIQLGAGVDIVSNNSLTLSADYDYETRSDYDSHSGLLKLRYDF